MGALYGPFESLPCAQTCRRVDFDWVEVREATRTGGGRLLLVSGIKPWVDLCVTLEPLAYREMPDFWMIELVGRLAASGLPGLVDFSVALPLDSVQGRLGIEIVGATKSEQRVLKPPGAAGRGD
ncbi:MAG: hypothetical protein KGL70_12590 [Betaproteobacteria bacterium]|nr:hypothetical protein [Betaproteobacteria bacterium]MDE2003637.1 hypothetical protein [Betaproteobacteria bacterium]MDE2210409.1 hypothetical protein [Betaproteobacteria bacterium]MDE2360209.1 hypothetical protein [Betaproteobacteria bacterium]